MHGYWEKFQELLRTREPFVSVTLVDVVASAPADVGAKMLVTADGLHFGSVGGGKIEMKAIGEAKGLLGAKQETNSKKHEGGNAATRFVEWNLQTEVGMTCGGVVRLYFEAYNIATWPVVIFGAGHCAQALVRLLLTMRCAVTVIDARPEWLAKLPAGDDPQSNAAPRAAGTLRVVHAEKSLVQHLAPLPRGSSVLLMTMGHATDQPILIDILNSGRGMGDANGFKYVGVIGSEAKAAALKRGLMAAGISEADATSAAHGGRSGKYFCPIGWPVGSNDPAEIAVSVAGQLLQVRG